MSIRAGQVSTGSERDATTTLAIMASWTDGAEYAPIERPDGFATPRTDPLSVAAPAANPADDQPAQRPVEYAAAPAALPLDRLVPAMAQTRNPAAPFQTTGAVTDSAWGALGVPNPTAGWTPTQPLPTSGTGVAVQQHPRPAAFPAPVTPPFPGIPGASAYPLPVPGHHAGAPAQYPAPTGAPSFPAPTGAPSFPPPTGLPGFPAPVDRPTAPPAEGLLRSTTPMMLVLLAGAFIQPLSPVLFAVAFALALVTDQGRKVNVWIFTAMSVVIGFFGVLGMVDGTSWDLMATAALGACWLTMVAVALTGLAGRGTRGR